jgi:DNA-nicking Smr family endonuclease
LIFDPLDGEVADTLDLHGFGAVEAKAAVADFLARARRRSPGGLVHVITGKGRGSQGRPVLRTAIRTMLRKEALPVAAWGEDLDGGGYLIRLEGGTRKW